MTPILLATDWNGVLHWKETITYTTTRKTAGAHKFFSDSLKALVPEQRTQKMTLIQISEKVSLLGLWPFHALFNTVFSKLVQRQCNENNHLYFQLLEDLFLQQKIQFYVPPPVSGFAFYLHCMKHFISDLKNVLEDLISEYNQPDMTEQQLQLGTSKLTLKVELAEILQSFENWSAFLDLFRK